VLKTSVFVTSCRVSTLHWPQNYGLAKYSIAPKLNRKVIDIKITEEFFMIGWLKRKALTASSKVQENEIRAQTQMFKGMSDDEIGFLVAGSTILRLNCMSAGIIPPEALDLSLERDDFKMDMVPIKLGKLIREFQNIGQPTDAAFTMILLHSTRSLCNPNIRVFGREMWAEISRGFPYARENLVEIEKMSTKTREISDEDLEFVPIGLEPFLG
jgi:hypothetical protein